MISTRPSASATGSLFIPSDTSAGAIRVALFAGYKRRQKAYQNRHRRDPDSIGPVRFEMASS